MVARFSDEVVWITGGGSGLGRAMVEFASKGCRVVVSGRRLERLAETVEAVRAIGGEAARAM